MVAARTVTTRPILLVFETATPAATLAAFVEDIAKAGSYMERYNYVALH